MKTTLGQTVTAAISRFSRVRIRGAGLGPAFVAVAVLFAATAGASSSPGAPLRAHARGRRHTFLVPTTSTEVGCASDSALCLGGGRFQIQAMWKTADGTSGSGHPVALTSDSGYFWFFDPSNVELAVKALNGCGVNGHYWVFAGGLTNVEVTLTATDTATGETRTYANVQGSAFRPIVDTVAFGSCSVGAASLTDANPEEPPVEASPTAPVRAPLAVRSFATEGCATSDTVLCVNGRFQVEASWSTPSGASGPAYAVPLTAESGYFWFFQPSNVELIVKSLNACSLDQGNWFFAAGMTDVGVELRVTDTETGESRTYSNPLGIPYLPIQDTGAFSFCPTPTPTPTSADSHTHAHPDSHSAPELHAHADPDRDCDPHPDLHALSDSHPLIHANPHSPRDRCKSPHRELPRVAIPSFPLPDLLQLGLLALSDSRPRRRHGDVGMVQRHSLDDVGRRLVGLGSAKRTVPLHPHLRARRDVSLPMQRRSHGVQAGLRPAPWLDLCVIQRPRGGCRRRRSVAGVDGPEAPNRTRTFESAKSSPKTRGPAASTPREGNDDPGNGVANDGRRGPALAGACHIFLPAESS